MAKMDTATLRHLCTLSKLSFTEEEQEKVMEQMGDIINLKDYKESAVLEEEYLKFLTHVNKFVGIPTTIPEILIALFPS